VIAEIVSLSGYEAQVSKLLDDDERIAMVFFIACMPEDHPVIPGSGGFRKLAGLEEAEERAVDFAWLFFLAEPRIYIAAIYAKSRKETLSKADQNVLAKLASQIKKAAKK
jgi:hypothetical protein